MPESSDKTSRLPGFYDKAPGERAALAAEWAGLSPEQMAAMDGSGGLTREQADHMIENVVGLHALPLGAANSAFADEVKSIGSAAASPDALRAWYADQGHYFRVAGRLTPGVTLEQARSQAPQWLQRPRSRTKV